MTLVADPPVAPPEQTGVPTPRSAVPTWRFAARLARREVRRRPGRTVLVALLVAAPVLAMTVASVMYRTTNDSWPDTFERRYGAADLVVDGDLDGIVDVLPAGARAIESVSVWTGLELPDGSSPPEIWVQFTDLPLTDPMVAGIVEVRDGRAPSAGDEVVLDRRTADRLGVAVGDTLTLARPSGDWRVVGVGRLADNHSQGLMVVHGFDRARLRPDSLGVRAHIDVPGISSLDEARPTIDALERRGVSTQNRWTDWWSTSSDVDARALAWGWVAGVLALAAVGIVIASAFATSARRQLVTIGHLSANGAAAGLIRRTLAQQGSWTGVIGTAGAMVTAVVGLVVLRPWAEHVVNRSLGAYRFVASDLVVIAVTAVAAATVAAAIPARTAARVPVLSALAGRRPLGSPPRRLVPIGVTLFLGGLGLLFVAATGARSSDAGGSSDVFALVAVVGALGVVFGMCCATPLVVAAVGRLGGSSASGTWRLAARSTARVRTRSSGVVTAVATAAAFAVAGVTIAAMSITDTVSSESLPRNVAYLQQWTDVTTNDRGDVDPPALTPLELAPEVRSSIERILPEARWDVVRAAGFDPRPFDPERGPDLPDDASEVRVFEALAATIADPAVLDLVNLDPSDVARLSTTDLVEVAPHSVTIDESGGVVVPDEVVFTDVDGDIRTTRAVATSGRVAWPLSTLMSAERAEALGFDLVEVGVLLTNPTDLTPTQRRALDVVAWGNDANRTGFVEPGDAPYVEPGPSEVPSSGLSVHVAWDVTRTPAALINAIIVGLAVLFTLLVVAIGLSLSATESRDERDVLVAVGAPPSTLARVAGAKAFVLAGTGVALAVPTGYLPTWVVYRTVDQGAVPFPWPIVTILVLVVPIVAGAAAWGTSAVARRLRPVRVSTGFTDD